MPMVRERKSGSLCSRCGSSEGTLHVCACWECDRCGWVAECGAERIAVLPADDGVECPVCGSVPLGVIIEDDGSETFTHDLPGGVVYCHTTVPPFPVQRPAPAAPWINNDNGGTTA